MSEERCVVCGEEIEGVPCEYVAPGIRIKPLCVSCMGLHVNHEWEKLNEILKKRRLKERGELKEMNRWQASLITGVAPCLMAICVIFAILKEYEHALILILVLLIWCSACWVFLPEKQAYSCR